MEPKEALEIVLVNECCPNSREFCSEECCPLFGTDCLSVNGPDKGKLLDAVRTLKKVYDTM